MTNTFKMIVIGTSQGGFQALKKVLSPMPFTLPVPILVVRHQSPNSDSYIISALNKACALKVKYAEMNERPLAGYVYLAPPDLHIVIGEHGKIQLSKQEKVNFSRPSIDLLFKSAAEYLNSSLIGVILTGANDDGSQGLLDIKKHGGAVIIQDPDNAEMDIMPKAAIAKTKSDNIVWLEEIGPKLWDMTK